MAISPIVQQHQRSIVQQSSSRSEFTFNKEFGDAAYDLFGSKYPRLLPYVVTFKVIDQSSTEEDGQTAVGVFIIARGADVGYVPVVMADGKIVSCEMIYNKAEDTLFPLIPRMISRIVDDNQIQDATLVKNPTIEDTHEVYKNMFRPPISSRPVLASTEGLVESLPDSAKEKLTAYFTEHPEMLGKVAEFYPVEALAAKLATASNSEKIATEVELDEYQYLDNVISLEELTKAAAEELTPELKAELLDKGYAITAEIENSVDCICEQELPAVADEVFACTEIKPGKTTSGTGYLLRFDGERFKAQFAVVSDSCILTAGKLYLTTSNTILLSQYKEGITHNALVMAGGFLPASEFTMNSGLVNSRWTVVATPTRNGRLRLCLEPMRNSSYRNVDGNVWLASENKSLVFTDKVSRGSVAVKNLTCYPLNAQIATFTNYTELPSYFVCTAQALTDLVRRVSAQLQLVKDGPEFNLLNRSTSVTLKFASEAELVDHLVSEYQMGKEGADTLLQHRKGYVFKQASDFGTSIPMGSSEHASGSMWGPPAPMQDPSEPLVLDESILEDTAALGDPELLDTGLVGSLAHTDDIKALLVDSVEVFRDTVTELGKSILLFALNKPTLEEYYGREPFAAVAHNLRTAFGTLGKLVFDLDEYVRNTEYSAHTA
jgi:hypothetical protein